ncbi:MAG TPA: sensor histidine kinase, partial [Vibrio sp.]|nr:sensor histidine kinase [Vibrio sp.]
ERTVEQLLNHATIRHRYQSIEPTEIDFNELVKQTSRGLAMNALNKDIELSYIESLKFYIRGDSFA